MENTHWNRIFLICNHLANEVQPGIVYQNFAKLMVDEEEGRVFNSQMTFYFKKLVDNITDLTCDDRDMIYSDLEIEELAELSPQELLDYYHAFCSGSISISLLEADN